MNKYKHHTSSYKYISFPELHELTTTSIITWNQLKYHLAIKKVASEIKCWKTPKIPPVQT